ncbi:unnamed protein product [Tenebrio molitor]|nr:unnamed protein product [Tenebrio molitor]
MGPLKALLLAAVVCVALGDENLIPPGPTGLNTTEAPTTSSTTKSTSTTTTTTSAPSTTTSTTAKPTTTKTTSPTTTSTTSKTTTTTSKTTTTTSKTTTTTAPITTTTKTTTTAKPSPPPVDPVGTWFVNVTNTNTTCLILQAALQVDLPYKVDNASKTFSIVVPPKASAGGACGENVENMTLTFSASNAVNFNFKKNKDGKKYDLESVVITLNVTLPGQKDWQLFVLAHNKDEFSTPVSNSYKCTKEQTFNLMSVPSTNNTAGILRISHLQVQAFRNETNTKFDEALDCQGSETPDVVPIAVGCALAALVIIVLVAYLIGRRRSQARGYLSM